MHRLKSAGLAVATLCLCLSPSIPAVLSPAIAQTAITQNQKAEGDCSILELSAISYQLSAISFFMLTADRSPLHNSPTQA
jgi:hypothetical protein